MNCISPPELETDQLLAYLDGEADHGTISHLEHCEYCREKANVLARLQDHLTSRLYRITCPSSLELGEYHLRMLPAPQMLVVAQHVRECPHCTREVAELDEYLAELAPQPGPLEQVRVLIAQLVGGQTGLPALRGEAKGPLTFEADGVVITLDVQPSMNGQVSILGQVAADDQDQWTGAKVELKPVDAPEMTASLDDLGAFRFEAVHPGSIQFTIISLSGVVIQSPNIEITA